jgi:telomere length regulation protein
VLQDIVVAAATAPAAGGVLSAAPASQRQAQAWQVQEEGLAAALASAPERAAAVQLPALEAAVYVPAVAAQLLDLLAADSLPAATQAMQLDQQQAQQQAQQPDQQQDQQQQQAATPAGAGTAFVADVLARFCRRGHQQLVVGAMLQRLMPGGQAPRAAEAAMASSIVAALPDSTALEKLLEAALKVAVQFNTHRTAPAPLPLNALPDADPAAAAAAAMLSALLPPAVWQARADARLLLTDSLLVKRQRGMLPLSALRGLLLFLHQREESAGSSSGSGSSEARHGLLPDVACRVAQLWGDTAAVQRLAAQQQAFLTAALCCCLRLMARRQLDGHPQLLQLCLAGITARLDSPLLGVRRQAMRVGQSLSALLDPAKPPMFAEDEQLWQLLPEEVWEAPSTAPPAPPYSSSSSAAAADNPPIRQQPAAAAAGGTARGTSSRKHAGSSGGREERRAAREERRRAQAAKRQARSAQAGRFEEAEGPQTETDSDDAEEGSSSISSSGTEAGSTSSGEFEQYDLEESDEEDPARSKLQVNCRLQCTLIARSIPPLTHAASSHPFIHPSRPLTCGLCPQTLPIHTAECGCGRPPTPSACLAACLLAC